MKNFTVIYEVMDIEYDKSSKLIRIIKTDDGKKFRIRIGVPVSTTNDVECHYWNGNEWTHVCGKYDINHIPISVYEQTPNMKRFFLETYDKVIKFIECII